MPIVYLKKKSENCILDHHLLNKTLPWDYDFRFVIEEISNINDKEQVIIKVWSENNVYFKLQLN